MNKKPAHLFGTAGQIVNRDIGDTEEMLYAGKAVYTIGDYVKQVQEQEAPKKKLTFEEACLNLIVEEQPEEAQWWAIHGAEAHDNYEFLKKLWKAAQENV